MKQRKRRECSWQALLARLTPASSRAANRRTAVGRLQNWATRQLARGHLRDAIWLDGLDRPTQCQYSTLPSAWLTGSRPRRLPGVKFAYLPSVPLPQNLALTGVHGAMILCTQDLIFSACEQAEHCASGSCQDAPATAINLSGLRWFYSMFVFSWRMRW